MVTAFFSLAGPNGGLGVRKRALWCPGGSFLGLVPLLPHPLFSLLGLPLSFSHPFLLPPACWGGGGDGLDHTGRGGGVGGGERGRGRLRNSTLLINVDWETGWGLWSHLLMENGPFLGFFFWGLSN